MSKQIDIEITPNIKGTWLKIDGQEISGLQKIIFTSVAEAGELTPEIVLEFEGHRMNESGELALRSNKDGSKTLDLFVQKIRGYSVTVKISGEFNVYPFE